MEDRTKEQIKQLRYDGLGYKRIARLLDISVDAVKSFCKRNQLTSKLSNPETNEENSESCCRNCGQSIVQLPKTKPRQFCSETCRNNWWQFHRSTNLKRGKAVTCKYCGKGFKVSPKQKRKFCSHACYIHHRFGGVYHE